MGSAFLRGARRSMASACGRIPLTPAVADERDVRESGLGDWVESPRQSTWRKAVPAIQDWLARKSWRNFAVADLVTQPSSQHVVFPPDSRYACFMTWRVLLLVLMLAGFGCGGQSPTSFDETTGRRAASAGGEEHLAAVTAELTQTVRKFGAEQRRVPKSLEELVAHGYLSRLPEAPPGRKFAINKNLEVHVTHD